MNERNVKQDVSINKYQLDEEAANISATIQYYDEKWNAALERLEKTKAQLENLNDEIKILKMELAFKAKVEWKDIPELNEGKSPSDKTAELWAVTQPEHKIKFNELKKLREEYAIAISTEALFKSYHYQLIQKSNKIDTLYDQWKNQYFTTDLSGGEKTKNSSNAIGDFAEKMTTRPTRREENV
jgi:hypothetical protein